MEIFRKPSPSTAVVRATFGPTLASTLDNDHSKDRRRAFIDRLEKELIPRIATGPVEMNAVLGTIVVAKL
jgi:hypothetical protein